MGDFTGVCLSLNSESPHLSVKAAGHVCVPSAACNLKSDVPLCKMIHCGYLDSIMHRQHTNLSVSLCTSNRSVIILCFPALCLTSWNTVDTVQRVQNEKSFRFPSSLHEVRLWQKWDVTVTRIPTSELLMLRMSTHYIKLLQSDCQCKKATYPAWKGDFAGYIQICGSR